MENISKLKKSALQQLKGNWGSAVVFVIIFSLIVFVAAFIPFIGGIFIIPVLQAGFVITFLGFYRGEKQNLVSKLFSPFEDYFRYLGTMILRSLYTLLWSLLFVIPGIIKSFSYALTPYILKDNPDLKFNSAITKSREMMNGHKWELFLLHLSFIGWYLLIFLIICLVFLGFSITDFFIANSKAIPTQAMAEPIAIHTNEGVLSGPYNLVKIFITICISFLPLIGLLLLIPYIQTTVSAFYEKLKSNETK